MIAYIIIIVVVAVLLVGVGSTMFLRPRGMHGVRRSRNGQLDMTGSMPAVKDADSDTESGGGDRYRHRAAAAAHGGAVRAAGARPPDPGEAAAVGRPDGAAAGPARPVAERLRHRAARPALA